MRKQEWRPTAQDDYEEFRRTNPAVANKVDELLADIERSPFTGIGKPEYLRYKSCWSRRINKKDRLTYNVTDDAIYIYSCGEHYDDR